MSPTQDDCYRDVNDDVEEGEEDLVVEDLDGTIEIMEVSTKPPERLATNASSKIIPSPKTAEEMPKSRSIRNTCKIEALIEALESTELDGFVAAAIAWCEEQGAVNIKEVVEDFEEFADALALKKLERKRLFRHLEGVLPLSGNSIELDSIDVFMKTAPSLSSSSCNSTSTSASSTHLRKPCLKMARSPRPSVQKPNHIVKDESNFLAPSNRDLATRASNYEDSASCKSIVSQCPLFEGLPANALDAVVNAVKIQDPEVEGSTVFLHGSDAQSMFFVLSGQVEIQSSAGLLLASICEQGFFGEIGVLFVGQRTASAIVSKGPCRLAKLERSELVKVALSHRFQGELSDRGQSLASVRTWFVKQLPLFAGCIDEPGFLSKVASALVTRKSQTGETLICEGEDGNEMFFIFDGSVNITKRRGSSAPIRLNAPNSFGELALLFAEPRSATVTCSAQCRLYILAREKLHVILQEYPKAIGAIYSTAKEATSLKAHFIRKIPLFQSMAGNDEFVANVSMALESCSAEPGEFLARQGQASDGRMFAIAHGHAEVLKVKKAGMPASVVANLSAGAFFGEIALLLDTPRMASVVARGHCHVYTLSRDAFETLAVVYEDWWQGLISEQGVLMKQVKGSGVGITASTTTRTHGLRVPELKGASVSSMLCAVEEPAEVDFSIPENRVCLVCRSAEKSMLSVPCGHISSCASCHDALKTCPICRASITGGHRAFF